MIANKGFPLVYLKKHYICANEVIIIFPHAQRTIFLERIRTHRPFSRAVYFLECNNNDDNILHDTPVSLVFL